MDLVDHNFVEQEIAKLSQELILSKFGLNGKITEFSNEEIEIFPENIQGFEISNNVHKNPSAAELQKDFLLSKYGECLDPRSRLKGEFFLFGFYEVWVDYKYEAE